MSYIKYRLQFYRFDSQPENLHEKDKDFEKEQENEIFFGEEEGGSDEDDGEEDSEEMVRLLNT